MKIKDSTAERFWAHVKKGAPDECWEWQGFKKPRGYGYFHTGGKSHPAHRIAYWIATGEFPDKALVCHSCDNPPCVNPAHLWLGTHKDNVRDMLAKGRNNPQRSKVGILNHAATMTDETVRAIRMLHPAMSIRQLERALGVKRAAIHRVLQGKTWKHVV